METQTVATASPKRWVRWWIPLAVLAALVLLVYACDSATRLMWDGWTYVRLVGSVVDEAGEPVPGARVTVIVDPDHPRYSLWMGRVGKTCTEDRDGPSVIEDEHAVRRVCACAAEVYPREDGQIDIVLMIYRGGTSSLLRRSGPPPKHEGIHLLIAEAEGFEPTYVVGSSRRWTCETYDGGSDEIGAKIDVGEIVLRSP